MDVLNKLHITYCVELGKEFSLKLTILLCDLHIGVLTFVEYNLYVEKRHYVVSL